MDRRSIISDLAEFRRPLESILCDLKRFPRDCEVPLVTFGESHLAFVLRRYRNSELTSSDVELWANAIEGRDDIEYDPDTNAGRLLHELANPVLTEPLTPARAAEMLELIS
jgi:hypothetical protein